MVKLEVTGIPFDHADSTVRFQPLPYVYRSTQSHVMVLYLWNLLVRHFHPCPCWCQLS